MLSDLYVEDARLYTSQESYLFVFTVILITQ